jgi:hypothetical protein
MLPSLTRSGCRVVLVVALVTGCGSSAKTPPTTSAGSLGGGAAPAPTTVPSVAGGAISESCPAASVVNAALAQSYPAAVSTTDSFGLTCKYGTGVSARIRFQKDTAATFAAGEAAVPGATKLSGLGDAAYVDAGFIAVLKGSVAVRITAPLATATQVEALARQIVG